LRLSCNERTGLNVRSETLRLTQKQGEALIVLSREHFKDRRQGGQWFELNGHSIATGSSLARKGLVEAKEKNYSRRFRFTTLPIRLTEKGISVAEKVMSEASKGICLNCERKVFLFIEFCRENGSAAKFSKNLNTPFPLFNYAANE
jgi:hypothetical protein